MEAQKEIRRTNSTVMCVIQERINVYTRSSCRAICKNFLSSVRYIDINFYFYHIPLGAHVIARKIETKKDLLRT